MEGLEISEIKYSQICKKNRYDSEYFQRKFLSIELLLSSKATFQLGDNYKVTDGEHGSVIIQDEGVKYLTAENIKKGYVDISNVRYVHPDVDERNARARVEVGDILLSIKGTLGEVAIAEDWLLPANMNRDVAILKPLFEKDSVEFVSIFLMSKYGALQSLRGGSGGVQQMLTLERIRCFTIPEMSANFYTRISSIYKKSQQLRIHSFRFYTQAQTLLLDSLGLADFSPSKEKVNIKSFKESFGTSGRLDAEYYQRKYEQVLAHIVAQPHAQLATVVNIQKSIEPGSDAYVEENEEGLPFLRVADYSKFGITKPQQKLKDSFVADNSTKLDELKPKKDTILFSKDGSVGEAYCLRENANFITSGAILHLTVHEPKKLLPDYLTLVLNSKLVQMQAERDAGGSILLHWRVGEIKEVVVPLIDIDTQSQIASLIQQSFSLKTESERLLESAKRAVEIAIEQSEEAAMKFLSEEVDCRNLVEGTDV